MLPLLKQLPQHSWCYMQSWCIQLNAVKLLPLEIQLWIPHSMSFTFEFRLFWSLTTYSISFISTNLLLKIQDSDSIGVFLLNLSLLTSSFSLFVSCSPIFFFLFSIRSVCLAQSPSLLKSLYFSGHFKGISKTALCEWSIKFISITLMVD